MEYISFGKWSVWMAICVMLTLLPVNVIAQPGFISINCGGKENHTDENNITWETDDNYIEVGHTADIGNASQQTSAFYLHSVRFFPKPLNKSCYHLPVTPNVPYLVRALFADGNYTGFQNFPIHFVISFETPGMLFNTSAYTSSSVEAIVVSSGSVLYICLIRIPDANDPFINAIELRTLRDGMYGQAAKTGVILQKKLRLDMGGISPVRYPQDQFDRIWYSQACVQSLSLEESISTKNTINLPPTAVMQTACAMNTFSIRITLGSSVGVTSLLLLYFADIETVNESGSRSFYISINGERRSETINLVPNYDAVERAFVSNETDIFKINLMETNNSIRRPLINALEYYLIYHTEQATYLQDIEALDAIKSRFDIKEWISDPCFVVPWDGIGCVNGSSAIRISEIKLSGRNIAGSVPEDIEKLTALVKLLKLADHLIINNHLTGPQPNFTNLTLLERLHLQNSSLNGSIPDWLSELRNLKELSLDNNYLIGPLPDFSRLTMLGRLHLQNNNLSGSLPDWLSELENLTELFINNNNFSGVIPAQLIKKTKLNLLDFRFFGNQYLCTSEGGNCSDPNPETTNNSTKGVVLGITISGGVIIILLVGIAVYWKQFKAKQHLNGDKSMIMEPNPTDSDAFSLKVMIEATKDFSHKIGQGGVGEVFFGKLPDGKDIAVKKLIIPSPQGVNQFRNEIDVLSKVQHKNLVTLLGYCNGPRELMLIYEYMSGGSLRDRLYGPSAELSNLNWTTRLKIALDAAQGLDFLHFGCTTKIIHRDVKAANILLDSNLNAKLADFGLSKMASVGEASHASTMVKGTPGYLDPEYCQTRKLTEKSDVYSFGVVLFEIICGRAATNEKTEEEFNIVQWVTPYVNREEIEEIVDKRLGTNYNMKSITRVAKVALRCVEAKPFRRPSISDVVAEIKDAIIDENENNAGFYYGYSETAPICSRADDMESGDSMSNLTQVGKMSAHQ